MKNWLKLFYQQANEVSTEVGEYLALKRIFCANGQTEEQGSVSSGTLGLNYLTFPRAILPYPGRVPYPT